MAHQLSNRERSGHPFAVLEGRIDFFPTLRPCPEKMPPTTGTIFAARECGIHQSECSRFVKPYSGKGFLQLNLGWNGEPNAPDPQVEVLGRDIVLRFYVNPFQFEEFEEDELGFIRAGP